MARFRRTSDDSGEETIDISPLIDCVFILLIFFIVTTTFVDESGIPTSTSQSSAPANDEEKTVITISLNAKGQVKVDGEDVGLSGIRPRIRTVLREEDAPVIIQSHINTPVDALVRARDESVLAGATKVSYANPVSGSES